MERHCKNCDKLFKPSTSRKEYCSDNCRQRSFRNNKDKSSVTNVTQTNDSVTQRVTQKLTKIDQLFQDDAIARGLGENWLKFSDMVREPSCRNCKARFKTRLNLLDYCSPDCRREEVQG